MIYFLRHPETGLIKIGKTKDKNMRLSQLQAQYGDLELLGLMAGYTDMERELHMQFSHLNDRDVLGGREWFRPDSELTRFINKETSLNLPLPIFEDARFASNHRSAIVWKARDTNGFRVENRVTEVIAEIISKLDITQKDMASRLGIDESQLSRMMRMQPSSLVSIDILTALHREFGKTPNDVLMTKERA